MNSSVELTILTLSITKSLISAELVMSDYGNPINKVQPEFRNEMCHTHGHSFPAVDATSAVPCTATRVTIYQVSVVEDSSSLHLADHRDFMRFESEIGHSVVAKKKSNVSR